MSTSLTAEDAVSDLLSQLLERPTATYTNEETKVTSVTVYCERRQEWTAHKRRALVAGLKNLKQEGLDVGTSKILLRQVKREDWAESWKRHFKAIEVGRRLLVRPGWIRARPRKGQVVVVLDPGLSFGTGNHPTTEFCLRALADFRRPGASQSLLDLGTGSGILAIAAAKLGYAPVCALDFDPEAVRVAGANARRNRVKFEIRQQDISKLPGSGRVQFTFICANLISNLLLAEREKIVNRLAPNGALAIAGILRHEFGAVQRSLEASGLRMIRTKAGGEWRSGLFIR